MFYNIFSKSLRVFGYAFWVAIPYFIYQIYAGTLPIGGFTESHFIVKAAVVFLLLGCAAAPKIMSTIAPVRKRDTVTLNSILS